jgi:membrane-associated phospholipid phosphatase
LSPSHFDIRILTALARFLGRYPLLDRAVQSAIGHNALGGFAYAAALFVFWVEGLRAASEKTRLRVLTTLLGSALAIGFTIVAEKMASWPPPANNPLLASLYVNHFDQNPNTNSFPSQSTALYSTVAAGIYSLCRPLGAALWVGIPLIIVLPRLYVGGHYLSDVVAGFTLGVIAYYISRYLLGTAVVRRVEPFFERSNQLRILREFLVFCWILQVAVEFRDAVWIKNCLSYLLR